MEINIRQIKNGWMVRFQTQITWDEYFAPTLDEALKKIAEMAEAQK